MKTIVILALLILLPLRAFGFCDDWNTQNTVLQTTFLAEAAYDSYLSAQYLSHADSRNLHEENPIFGTPHPSEESFAEAFLAAAVIHTAIACYLTGDTRTAFQGTTIAVEFYVISRFASFGVGIHF